MKVASKDKIFSFIILALFFSFSQNAKADEVAEMCSVVQSNAEDIMEKRRFNYSYQEQSNRYLNLDSIKDYQFLQNYMKSVLDKAYKKKLPKSESDRLDQVFAFGEEVYQDCLPKMQAFKKQLNNKSKTLTFVNVQADGVCGFLNSCLVKKLSVTPPSNSGVKSEQFGSGATLAHHQGIPVGNYGYTIYFTNSKMCSGSFYFNGTKSNIKISVYDDCRQAGIYAN